jgi:hypothetical protein
MDGISSAGTLDQAAMTMLVKDHQQKKQDAANAARLIQSAMVRPLPPDATFSTHA